MATAYLNPIITSLSGGVGSLVFYKRYGKTIMRAWVLPPNPRTQAQQANRERFARAMAAWQGLSSVDKAALNIQAKKRGMTGHNLFISRFMKGQTKESCIGDTVRPCSCTVSPLDNGAWVIRPLPVQAALSRPFFTVHPAHPSVAAPSYAGCRAYSPVAHVQRPPG